MKEEKDMKEKVIVVGKQELERSIDMLTGENVDFMIVDKNLFSISKISTILKPVIENDPLFLNKKMTIEFAYADRILPMDVKIVANFNSVSSLEFVKTSKMLNESQLLMIADKVMSTFKENYSYCEEKLTKMIDDMTLNETIVFLTKALNKDDCEEVKNDFITKFETWKQRMTTENEELKSLMDKLFSYLMTMKVWKKSQL